MRAFDLDPARVARAVMEGSVEVRSATEAARGADAVLTVLPTAADVEEALLGPPGVASPLGTEALAMLERVEARGEGHLDFSAVVRDIEEPPRPARDEAPPAR